jgi:hypothetical protein
LGALRYLDNEERFWVGGAAHKRRSCPSVAEAAPVSQKRVGLNRCPEMAMGIVAARSLPARWRNARIAACGLAQRQRSRFAGSGWRALGAVHDAVLAGRRRSGKRRRWLGHALWRADRRCQQDQGHR